MEVLARNLSGEIVKVDLAAKPAQHLALGNPASEPGVGQLESANLIRKDIEKIIRNFSGDPGQAAIQICVMLDEHFDLASNGFFERDEVVEKAILEADQDSD